ncbi:MAG: cytochrome c biogenesis protein CcsA [Bacteroidetes bacterium]|nr:cytochrome c biogenesis protein CcsA [Bacteroidota bacterium]
MKRILNFLLSSKATLIFLLLFAVAMAVATFVEDKYDTVTARQLIYNTLWFELLFLLLIVNLIGHIKPYHLFTLRKLGGLLFHFAFIAMILGAFITRYFGSEASMHIRKGETSNIIYSNEPAILISCSENDKNYNFEFPVNKGDNSKNTFTATIPTAKAGNIEIRYKELIPNAVAKIEENVAGGKNMIELAFASAMGMQKLMLSNGELKNIGSTNISFNSSNNTDGIRISDVKGIADIIAPIDIVESSMDGTQTDTIRKDSTAALKEGYLYHINGTNVLYSKMYKNARKVLVSGTDEMGRGGDDVVILDVNVNGKKQELTVFNTSPYAAEYEDYVIEGVKLSIAFGNKPVQLPFSLCLKDFILERYPGSESPSSYRSEVTLIDSRESLKEDRSIFMNNVLDYNKYRFFQSSYDNDEQGTVLSVNHDFWGTTISYLGYVLLGIGFVYTLFSKYSRFSALKKSINEIREKRKAQVLTLVLLFASFGLSYAQPATNKVVDANHAIKLGHMLTQTYDGRFAPVHTLALDLMHKIAKKETYEIEGKGKMNAMQVFIDIIAEPQFWQDQKIIYVPQKQIQEVIGINTEYAAFRDFFDANSQYKLEALINESFRKKQSEKNKLDREILKVDERVNIFHMMTNGSILKIFPEQNSKNNKWLSWDDKVASIPLTGAITAINEDLKLKVFSYSSLMQAYVFEVIQAKESGDYSKADKILDYITAIQKQNSDPNLLPSETKINAEVFYNNADIFILLKNVYALLSVLMLVLAFIDNVRIKKSKIISLSLNILTVILMLAFLYHTIGMGLRWYITGHAPWANGYEALILVAWGSLIAGFGFVKYSKLTLAATALLAFFMLMTASHSSYDPQLTNLPPVLKSYWLIIHVATLTISYGFLGLGFILGLMNLFIYLFKNQKNAGHLDLLIAENSYIIEMNLIIGLMLATLGTFLGAVWANESWGKYWGWDAKETWALIIVITYSIVIHMRFVPKLNTKYAFNVASVLGFSSVMMTFVGVNYYLSKGMHSYGAGETPVFPLWAWGTIFAIIILIISAGIREKNYKQLKSN